MPASLAGTCRQAVGSCTGWCALVVSGHVVVEAAAATICTVMQIATVRRSAANSVHCVVVLFPLAGIGLFFCSMSVLEGSSLQEAWASTKQKFKPTLMANYLLWPAANLVNFAFVPPAQRILYCNVVYVSDVSAMLAVWCCWLCSFCCG
jgi:hypothetical protein